MRLGYIKEQLEANKIRIQYLPTSIMPADALTKAIKGQHLFNIISIKFSQFSSSPRLPDAQPQGQRYSPQFTDPIASKEESALAGYIGAQGCFEESLLGESQSPHRCNPSAFIKPPEGSDRAAPGDPFKTCGMYPSVHLNTEWGV